MVDPTRVTNYKCSRYQLEELILFCIAVAGKNATTTAKNLDKLLRHAKTYQSGSPFEAIIALDANEPLAEVMRTMGFGCYNLKAKGFLEIANSGLNLAKCDVKDLEAINGIGMKTSRYFVLHTRERANYACLDTHVLNWLRYYTGDDDIPTSTPSSKKKYREIEVLFLDIAAAMSVSPADLDLKIWNAQRGSIPQEIFE